MPYDREWGILSGWVFVMEMGLSGVLSGYRCTV